MVIGNTVLHHFFQAKNIKRLECHEMQNKHFKCFFHNFTTPTPPCPKLPLPETFPILISKFSHSDSNNTALYWHIKHFKHSSSSLVQRFNIGHWLSWLVLERWLGRWAVTGSHDLMTGLLEVTWCNCDLV